MTRINVVPVKELCDQHLLAEHREMTRIPNNLLKGKLKYDYSDRPADYVLGAGHIKFFTNKLQWLNDRYDQVHMECLRRGFNVTYKFRTEELKKQFEFSPWKVTLHAKKINRERIEMKMPKKPRFTKRM